MFGTAAVFYLATFTRENVIQAYQITNICIRINSSELKTSPNYLKFVFSDKFWAQRKGSFIKHVLLQMGSEFILYRRLDARTPYLGTRLKNDLSRLPVQERPISNAIFVSQIL